jgi:hypothetical protein
MKNKWLKSPSFPPFDIKNGNIYRSWIVLVYNTHQTQTKTSHERYEKHTIHETNERNETNELCGKRKQSTAQYTNERIIGAQLYIIQ